MYAMAEHDLDELAKALASRLQGSNHICQFDPDTIQALKDMAAVFRASKRGIAVYLGKVFGGLFVAVLVLGILAALKAEGGISGIIRRLLGI